MPLTMVPEGQKFEIKKINGKDEIKTFLESLGFVVGGTIIVISRVAGNMIVNIKEARVAISKSMANRIIV